MNNHTSCRDLKTTSSTSLQYSTDLPQEKGASTWLTSLPLQEFGFALHKCTFQDALTLRYNCQPLQAPSTCASGTKFSVEHALRPKKGGFPSIQHNEIRDLTANLLTEVYTMWALSQIFSQLRKRCSPVPLRILLMVQAGYCC